MTARLAAHGPATCWSWGEWRAVGDAAPRDAVEHIEHIERYRPDASVCDLSWTD